MRAPWLLDRSGARWAGRNDAPSAPQFPRGRAPTQVLPSSPREHEGDDAGLGWRRADDGQARNLRIARQWRSPAARARRPPRARCPRLSSQSSAAPSPTASAMLPVPASKRAGAGWYVVRLEGHVLDHVAAALPRLHGVEHLAACRRARRYRLARRSCARKTRRNRCPVAMLTGKWATACAPSTRVRRPTAWAMATICCAGVMVPRAFDTWVRATNLVRGHSSLAYASSITSPRSLTG